MTLGDTASVSRRARAALMCIVVIVQCGCASMVGGPSGIIGPPAEIGRAVLVVEARPLRVDVFNIPRGKAEAAGSEAGRFLLQCAGAGGAGGGSYAGAAYILWLAGCAIAAPVAAGLAAHKTESADQVAQFTAVVSDVVALDRLAADLARAAAQTANAVAPGRLVVAQEAGAVDSELRLGITKIVLAGDGSADDPVRFGLTLEAKVVRDGAPVKSTTIAFTSEARRLREWAANDGQLVNAAVERGIVRLAESAADFAFLLYPFPYVGQPHAGTWFTGLQAEYPPRAGNLFDPWWASVDSLRPVFRWERFPREVDRSADPATMARVANVAYDLMIAAEETEAAGPVVYRKTALASNTHQLETDLAPARRFFWTVRARFELDGRQFVTQWAERGALPVLTPTRASQSSVVPSHLGYPFKTK